jgi:methyl-accepting chemotaxis protein
VSLLSLHQMDVSDTRSHAIVAILLGTLTAVIMAAVVGAWVARSIKGPISDAVHAAETIAKGDLTSSISTGSGDETGLLLRTLATMQSNLIRLVTDIQSSAAAIDRAAKEVAAGNTDLSTRTEEQAATLEETAASMEELTSTVSMNTQNAGTANELSVLASRNAEHGGRIVEKVVVTMSGIAGSSQRVADIIGTIESIAFQTNILALNAAVEAARAGEQGRGFAVVASEVRSLAQRSAAAAKEINDLITDSVGRVREGSSLATEAGRAMGDMVSSVQRVSHIMREIATASEEQSTGIGQVSQAVAQMDEVTQQNAALVEQAAVAAASLEEQAAQLTVSVSAFRLPARTKP